MKVECVGAIGDYPLAISKAALEELLSSPVAINSDGEFVGKPETRLYATRSLVLKRPCDESMTREQARAWCERQLIRERRARGYHPARTWVAFCKQTHWAVANITPRLPTLERVLGDALPSSDKLDLLLAMLDCFFSTYRESEARQDEGLRNYVVDGSNVWYIDDDLYGHDNLTALSASLGTYLRSLDWLTGTSAFYLGARLRKHIMAVDPPLLDSVYKGCSDTFLPKNKQRIRQALLRGLGAQRTRRSPQMSERIAVIADIHANLPALEAVLADCEARQLTSGIVLGDIVGYGPDPSACVERIRETGFAVIMGNHDQAASSGEVSDGLSRAARWSVPWTYHAIPVHQRDWLSDLPRYFHDKAFYAVHGAPQDPRFMHAYVYARTAESNLDYMRERNMQLCLHGHSHLPGVWFRDITAQAVFSHPDHFDLSDCRQAMICPGSVGQPRNDDHAAQYAVLDLGTKRVDFVRVAYDVQSVLSRMESLGFPDYVTRLFQPA